MIVNPIDGQKYPVTSNIGRGVLKKYINTYKYGGSDDYSEDSDFSDSVEEILESVDVDITRIRGEWDGFFNHLHNIIRRYYDLRQQLRNSPSIEPDYYVWKDYLVEQVRKLNAKDNEILQCQNQIRELQHRLLEMRPPVAPGGG